jgi:hypothetical protein
MDELDFEAMVFNENKKFIKNKYAKTKYYGSRKLKAVQSVYIFSSLFWILLIYLLKLYQTDFFGILILLIPLVIFTISFINSSNINEEVENNLYKANYLSIGLIIVLPLLTWFTNDYKGDTQKRIKFISIIIVALTLTLFSLVDIWISKKWYPVVKHVKSVFQTMSITLIIFALYMYYVERINYEK